MFKKLGRVFKGEPAEKSQIIPHSQSLADLDNLDLPEETKTRQRSEANFLLSSSYRERKDVDSNNQFPEPTTNWGMRTRSERPIMHQKRPMMTEKWEPEDTITETDEFLQ